MGKTNKNAYFQLEVREKGTYLKLYPAQEGGEPLNYDEVARYLHARKLEDFSNNELFKLSQELAEETELRVGGALSYPVSEAMDPDVSMDKMTLTARFYPPSNGGNIMAKEDVVSDLAHYRIRAGVQEQEIDRFLQERQYCTDYVLARGVAPVNGTDAWIEYFFNTDVNTKPKANEDGTVDYKNLDNISQVSQGDVLARLHREDPGKYGMNVMGEKVKPKTVKHLTLKFSNNIELSEDQMELRSLVTGHAKLVEDRVFVSDVYDVPADVDNSTGNIDYSGNVHIKGNVRSGFSIKAKGDVIVDGVVEGAEITAEGQIVLKRGIQGMGKGKLTAGSHVVAKFIESSEVVCDGYIETESILHSQVSAKNEIVVSGKKGFVTGGSVCAGHLVSARTIGSDMGAKTLIEVGVTPQKRERQQFLEKETGRLSRELEKIYPVLSTMWKKMAKGELDEKKQQQVKILGQQSKQMEQQKKGYEAELEELKQEIDQNTNAKVVVKGEIFPGVTVIISGNKLNVDSKRTYCQFVREDYEIRAKNL